MAIINSTARKKILADWKLNTTHTEWTFHQLSPYIGKIKSSIATALIKNLTEANDTIYDPYCGAGTIPFEAWVLNRNVIANDLNVYANLLTTAKLNPPNSPDEVLLKLDTYYQEVVVLKGKIDLRRIPKWVRNFFHKETLRETCAWIEVLKRNDESFILACLMGILHHQRPGFLSFPSSHAVPYLRIKNFPPNVFPELYEYRDVYSRLLRKVIRAFKRQPSLNCFIDRKVHSHDATVFIPNKFVDAIITSPPYMRQLDYARDNRLRLWFLGVKNIKQIDKIISPNESDFIKSIKIALISWNTVLKSKGRCILILGDTTSKMYKMRLPEMIIKIAVEELGFYKLESKFQSIIPNKRRIRKNYKGSQRETVLVLKKIS